MKISAVNISHINKNNNTKLRDKKMNVASGAVSFGAANISRILKTTESGKSSKLLESVLNSRLNIKHVYENKLYILTNSNLEQTACSLNAIFNLHKLEGFRPETLEIIQDDRILLPLFMRKYSARFEKNEPYFLLGIHGNGFEVFEHKTNKIAPFFRGRNEIGAKLKDKILIPGLDPIELNPTINMKDCMHYITEDYPENFLRNNMPKSAVYK